MLPLLLLALVSAPVQALIEKAERQMEEADFAGAEATLRDALAQPDNDDAALIAIYGQLAQVFLYEGREEEARGTFEKVLYLDPRWTPPEGASPKVRGLFADVLARFRASATPIEVAHDLVRGGQAGRALEVTATIRGLKPPSRAMLQFKTKLAPAWSSTELLREEGDRFVAVIPGPALEPGDLDMDYYIEVQDALGTRLHGVGSAQQPLSFHVDPAPPPPRPAQWYEKWWVWAIAGSAAVGIAALAIVPNALAEPTGSLTLEVKTE